MIPKRIDIDKCSQSSSLRHPLSAQQYPEHLRRLFTIYTAPLVHDYPHHSSYIIHNLTKDLLIHSSSSISSSFKFLNSFDISGLLIISVIISGTNSTSATTLSASINSSKTNNRIIHLSPHH